jgi:hypothetical protein
VAEAIANAPARRSPQALAAIRDGGVGGRVDGRNKIAHSLEFL